MTEQTYWVLLIVALSVAAWFGAWVLLLQEDLKRACRRCVFAENEVQFMATQRDKVTQDRNAWFNTCQTLRAEITVLKEQHADELELVRLQRDEARDEAKESNDLAEYWEHEHTDVTELFEWWQAEADRLAQERDDLKHELKVRGRK